MFNKSSSTQENLFDAIRRKIGNDINLAQELMMILDVSKDGAYRRLNGKIHLSLDEASQIASFFGVVLADLIATNREQVLFDFSYLSRPVNSFVEYLLPLDQDLSVLQRLNNPKVFFASNDIPMFHTFQFPKLALFKLYFWGYTVWKLPDVQKQKFSLKMAEGATLKLCQSMTTKYASISSDEFWSSGMIDNTINRIKFGLVSGLFENAHDALILLQDVLSLMNHAESMAELGVKYVVGETPDKNAAAFSLHRNDLFITNNTVLVKTDNQRLVYQVFDNPNYMRSSADSVANHAEAWFDKLRRYSDPLTISNEAERKAYFNILRERVDNAIIFVKRTYME